MSQNDQVPSNPPNQPNPSNATNNNQSDRNSNRSVSISDDQPSSTEAALFNNTLEIQILPNANTIQVITNQPTSQTNPVLPSANTLLSPFNPLPSSLSPRQSPSLTLPSTSQLTDANIHLDTERVSAFDWQTYENRAFVLQKLKEERKFVDVQLISEDGQTELVHSVVMSALGDRLSSCIFPQRDDPKTPCIKVTAVNDSQMVSHVKQVHLTGVSGQVLRTLVECAYSGQIKSSTLFPSSAPSSSGPSSSVPSTCFSSNKTDDQLVWAILQTAEQFAIHELVAACCTHLIFRLNCENCIRLLQLGLRCGHRLRTAAWNFIRVNFDQVLEECSDFGMLTFEQLDSLLEDDTLNLKEGEPLIWQAIRKWILIEPTKRAIHLKTLLNRIRFGRLPNNYAEENILKDPVLAELAAEAETILTEQNKEAFLRLQPLDKENKKESKSEEEFTSNYMQQCVQMLQQMAAIRRNECSQYRIDGNGMLVGLTPQLVRPRVPNEVLFAIGGWLEGVPTTSIETYDVRTDQWFEYSMYHQQPRAYHGIEVLDGLCYLIGGTNGTEILSSVHCFDPTTGRWYERANMYEQRCYVSTAQLNGLIYAMGGHNGLQRVRSVERYDQSTNQWHQVTQMSLARSDASATVFEGRIYIAGGLNDQVMENSVEMFDPTNSTWTFIQPMSSARTSFSLSAYGNNLYALGGNNGFERLATVEKYDFNTKLWTTVEPMTSRRSTFTACVLEDKLYVIGGYNGHTPINLVEAFDRKTGRWSPVRSIKYDRSGLAVCVIKGLANASEYTFLGMTAKKLFKSSTGSDSPNPETEQNSSLAVPSTSNLKQTTTPLTLNPLRPVRYRFGSRYRRRILNNRASTEAGTRRSTSVLQGNSTNSQRIAIEITHRARTSAASTGSLSVNEEQTLDSQNTAKTSSIIRLPTVRTVNLPGNSSERVTTVNQQQAPSTVITSQPNANQSNSNIRDVSTVVDNEIHGESDSENRNS